MLAACSSSGSSPSSGAGQASASGAGSATANTEVAAAQKYVAQVTAVPAEMPETQPLKTTPAQGKTIVYLECNVVQCATYGTGVDAAAKLLGWSVKTLQFSADDPATLVSAMKQALQIQPKPVAVAFSTFQQQFWQQMVPAYQKAGIMLVPAGVGPVTLDPPALPAGLFTVQQFSVEAKAVANWFIADSKAQGHALIVDIPALQQLKAWTDSATATISAGCKACTTSVLNANLQQMTAGTIGQAVVSYVQSHPDIKYILTSYGTPMDNIPTLLNAAGLSDIQFAGGGGDVTNLTYVKTQGKGAFIGENSEYTGWLMVDAAARYSEGMSFPSDYGLLPYQLMVPGNVGTPAPDQTIPPSYQSLFAKLWKVQ
jgi:ribose transport system substrate-binding protein